MSIEIRSVRMRTGTTWEQPPYTATVGQMVVIEVEIIEHNWLGVKGAFTNWQDIRSSMNNWLDLKNW